MDLRTTKRRWFKLHANECLNGSIRWQLTAEERGVWYDLLVFSAVCSNTGMISDRDGNPFPLSFIANRLNISQELLETTISKCRDEGRLTVTDGVIQISNWNKYQSEYDRVKDYQQAYRERKKYQG